MDAAATLMAEEEQRRSRAEQLSLAPPPSMRWGSRGGPAGFVAGDRAPLAARGPPARRRWSRRPARRRGSRAGSVREATGSHREADGDDEVKVREKAGCEEGAPPVEIPPAGGSPPRAPPPHPPILRATRGLGRGRRRTGELAQEGGCRREEEGARRRAACARGSRPPMDREGYKG